MIKRLALENCFIHRKAEFLFGSGVTAITGENESGKSLILEMIRYALFGTKALRGNAKDYKDLKVELDFVVEGTSYQITRSRLTLLASGNTPLAVGTIPVNTKVRELLGYDLAVFDVANACNQGMVEQLTTMRPADRKAMVDRTIGLDQVDELLVKVTNRISEYRTVVETLKSTIIMPVEPEAPADYEVASEVNKRLIKVKELETDLANHQAWIAATTMAEPVMPMREVDDCTEDLSKHEMMRLTQAQRVNYLKGAIAAVPPVTLSAEQITGIEAAWEAWDQYQLAVLSADEVKGLMTKLTDLSHECPECGHAWIDDDDYTRHVKERIAKLEKVGAGGTAPPCERPTITQKELIGARVALESDLSTFQNELSNIVILADRSQDLKKAQKHDWDLSQYSAQLKRWHEWNRQVEWRKKQIAELQEEITKQGNSASLTDLYFRCMTYEGALRTYNEALKGYNETLAKLVDAEHRLAQYTLVRHALRDLKVRVKGFLVPSLNAVSSRLLERMTGGKRNTIKVDDEFEIEVDDQPIHTLSGSGKAVANLAIRIGLGQVLTNRVFSVFLGDEIDASMDEDRAESTAECLRNLTGQIKQIFLVSHKRPEADAYVEL